MTDLKRDVQAALGRPLIGREFEALKRLVSEHGRPRIETGDPPFNGDARRPVFLTWVMNGEERTVSLAPSAPAAKPRDLVREHVEQHGGGMLHRRRTELDGRRTVEVVRVRGARPTRTGRSATIGRGRAVTRAASPSRGSPGDDSDSESSEPPSRRLCAFCGDDIPPGRSPKATHCSDKHAARDRKRRQRQREREQAKLPAAPITAADRRMFKITDEDRERLWELAVCRCNGHHLELEPGWCTKCGHHLPRELDDGAERYAAFMKRLAEPTVVQRLVERYREQVAR